MSQWTMAPAFHNVMLAIVKLATPVVREDTSL
jgi:hypothetical protein